MHRVLRIVPLAATLGALPAQERVPLVEGWSIAVETEPGEVPTASFEPTRIGEAFEHQLGDGFEGTAWYRLELERTLEPGQRARLLFHGVATAAQVLADRATVGTHLGAWTPFDVDVTIVELAGRLLPLEDADSSKAFERAFRKRGIAFHTGVRFQGVTQDDAGLHVSLENGTTIDADLMLVAVGRGPRTADLGYEEQGVPMDRGFVLTDERLHTGVASIHAVGDIVPGHTGKGGDFRLAERLLMERL